ncbi:MULTISPECIES: hypothetical protein [Cyanophyceae]|uniref:hypothetical protein n=1 Tax=Cyanophyceae TaxID=3028117 RepID=UPI00168580BC|nr:hypothetical protein [Trichocoleus sp. FACHB-69]MBD1930495.1 hypothetical protein [Trichocoleus sp. FACHB-69]
MNLRWIERLGDWNPQLLRELKGNLKNRNLLITVGISVLTQFLLLTYLYEQAHYSFWESLFPTLNWILPLILLLAGVYMLITDLGKEERRGTLNFIRLSPQSSQSILIGKMLGVPIIVYLGVALAVPLHLWTAISAGVPFIFILSFYLLIGAGCCFFYTAALLYGFLGGFQAWAGTFLSFVFAWPLLQILNFAMGLVRSKDFDSTSINIYSLQWFHLPLGSVVLTEGFIMLNFGLWTYWIWQALNRRFSNANATLISKKQSYWITGCFEVILIGFCLQNNHFNPARTSNYGFLSLLTLVFEIINLLWFVGLIAALSPHRQSLQTWARYRRERVSKRRGFWKSDLVQDLIWGEKSPAVVAVAINLGIKTAVWGAWILSWPANSEKMQAILGLILSLNWILIYAVIVQSLLFMKTDKRSLWASMTVTALIAFPPVFFGLLSMPFYKNPGVWLLTAFPLMAVKEASVITVFMVILGQWSAMTLLSLQLRRQMRLGGVSASKALFAK